MKQIENLCMYAGFEMLRSTFFLINEYFFSFADLSLVSQLLISYATQGKKEEMEMIIQKTRNLNNYQHFNAQPVAVSTLVAKLFDHNIEHFCEFPFSKYRFEPPYMYIQ